MKYPHIRLPVFRVSFLFLFMFLIMWFLFGWNTDNADYDNYQRIYDSISQYGGYSGVEIGFEFVCRMGATLGLSYNGFLMIYSFIGLSLIASTARKYSTNHAIMFILYFIYPFLVDIVQIRNFMAMALVIFATRYLVTNENKDYLKYIIFVLLASTFHYSALFYMLFLLVKIKSYKKLIYVTLAMVIIGLFARSLFPSIVGRFLSMERYGSYFSDGTSFYRIILFFIYFCVSATLTYYVYKRIKSDNSVGPLHEADKKKREQHAFAEVVMKINILIFVAYVLVLVDVNFIRLIRNILPLNYIVFSMIKPKYRITKNVNVLVHSWIFWTFVALSSGIFLFVISYQGVVYPVFNNNLVLDFFK